MGSCSFGPILLGFLGLSSALLEPMPLPRDIQECYEQRSFNMTPSSATATYIQNICFKNYEYTQIAAGKVWSGPNITQKGVNYINSLFRQIFQEAEEVQKIKRNGGRKKRQIPRRFRREIRSPGAFEPFAKCVQDLQRKITNQQLYERTRSIPLSSTIKRKRWRWIGHILRREENSHIRTALTWAPEGKRRRGRPKNTWRRSVEREREELGWNSWKEGQVVASDRRKWRSLLNGLMRPQGHGEDKMQRMTEIYQTLAALHSGHALITAHDGPGFAPWHRIYLLLFETACGVPIPYWDSGLDHVVEDPTQSIIWSGKYFGNGNNLVVTGPFRNMRNILGTGIIRNYGTGNNALFTKSGYEAILSRRNYGEITEPKFGPAYAYTLEGHHNGPHGWTGGHLARPESAPWDPIFYMHHAYVDAVWQRFREKQARNGINPETDYPANPPPGHGIDDVIDFRPYVNLMTNRVGMSNFIANLVTYEDFPTCENHCNGSPDLTCNRGVCVSRRRTDFAFDGELSGQGLAFPETEEPIPAGEKFRSSPFRDTRNRHDSTGTAPVAPEIQAASRQVRLRRDVSQFSENNSSQHNHLKSFSSIARSFTNSFILDGEVDPKRWVYVPVRIVYTRSPNVKGRDPTLLSNVELGNDLCPTIPSGASKVFVTSNGLSYYGYYEEFAIIDDRQPFSVTTTAVGIKNPDFGEGEVLFTAYDSCGRPCRPLCLTSVNGQRKYKGCSGAFKISSAVPAMYRSSYKDALSDSLSIHNLIDSSQLEDSPPPLTILCGNDHAWPWDF